MKSTINTTPYFGMLFEQELLEEIKNHSVVLSFQQSPIQNIVHLRNIIKAVIRIQ